MNKVYLAVDIDGTENMSHSPLERWNNVWIDIFGEEHFLIPTGTIKKLIGRKLIWEDEPVLWEGE